MKHLLKMADLSTAEIIEILDLADELKLAQKQGKKQTYLDGKSVAMIFAKASTRTRTSFEVGIYQMGGNAVFLNSNDLQIGRGEPVEDTARVMGRYFDGIMIRTFAQSEVQALADYSGIPVINGLTDYAHPCQTLADLQTIREHKKRLEGVKMCYIGDGNNVANSLIVGAIKTGMNMVAVCPKGYEPAKDVLDFANKSGNFTLLQDPKEGAIDADVLVTDVWASMGQEEEAQKRKIAFEGYQLNNELLKLAKKDVMVQHCLPAHREEEITAEVFEAHANEIFDEAENRMHSQKAVMALLMG